MAVSMDQQQGLKYFCRICKKGFGCGRALGGHMRAHGIGDEAGHADDEDPASDWEEKHGGCSSPPASNKRMYALRTNPNRLRSCRICENCGKEFSSWKSFLEHGKCGYDDAESLMSSPAGSEEGGGEANDEEDGGHGQRDCGGGWSKGKRTRRFLRLGSSSNCPTSEEEDLANWLVMLSSARVDPLVAETEESCASASKEEDRQRYGSGAAMAIEIKASAAAASKGVPRGMFECKACKKVFSSHQALGGHRASHKKVKGCFAARQDDDQYHHPDESQAEEEVITHDDILAASKIATLGVQFEHPAFAPTKRKSKVHECSICHRVFASGQALGGHKRCHWVTSNTPEPSIARLHSHQLQPMPKLISKSELLDLNLPAPVDDIPLVRQENEAPIRLDVSAALYLQPWMGTHPTSINNTSNHENMINMSSPMAHLDSEADSKVKLAKLSDLKDMNAGGSSPWLQVGIGTSTASESRVP